MSNNKGAISVYAMIAMIFFIAFTLGAYTIVSGRNRSQIEQLTKLRSIYSSNIKQKGLKYADKNEEIPITNYQEYLLIGQKCYVEKDGTIYYFGGDDESFEYKYRLRNSIFVRNEAEKNKLLSIQNNVGNIEIISNDENGNSFDIIVLN